MATWLHFLPRFAVLGGLGSRKWPPKGPQGLQKATPKSQKIYLNSIRVPPGSPKGARGYPPGADYALKWPKLLQNWSRIVYVFIQNWFSFYEEYWKTMSIHSYAVPELPHGTVAGPALCAYRYIQNTTILTSTGGSRPENSKIQNFDEKSGFLEKSPLQFPIVQNSNYWLKCKNRFFCQQIKLFVRITKPHFSAKIKIPHFYPLWGAYLVEVRDLADFSNFCEKLSIFEFYTLIWILDYRKL